MKVKKAVIPAAGLGTRFLPATKAQPKEMLPIVDKPTIQYIVEEAIQSGIEDIILVTGRGKTAIEDHFDRSYELEAALDAKGKTELLDQVKYISNLASIHYVRQKEIRGLGHAVWCARKFIGGEPFAVLLGDDVVVSEKPCLRQLIGVFEEYLAPVIGIQEVRRQDVSKYGIVKTGAIMKEGVFVVEDMVEKPDPQAAPSNLAIMGRYILTPEIFKILDRVPPGAKGEIELTDALQRLSQQQKIMAFVFNGTRYDVGDKFGYIRAVVEFALRRDDLREKMIEYLQDAHGRF